MFQGQRLPRIAKPASRPRPGALEERPLRLTATIPTLAVLLALTGCPGEPASDGIGAPTGFQLPPPLAETRPDREPTTPVPVDPEDWQLPDPAGDPEHPPWLRLFYIQDNQAELEACGCPGQPTGGMARRATLAGEIRATLPDAVVVEGPTALSRAVLGYELVRGDHVSRARVLLESIADSHPTAFFPGQADFAVLEPGELARRAAALDLPLVATNLAEPASDGYRPWLVLPVEGRTALLLGLVRGAGTEERRARAPVTDAVAAAAAAVEGAEAELGGQVDLVIAFSDGDLRDLRRLREGGLDVDVLLARPEPSDDRRSWLEPGYLVVRADPLGRAFGRLDVALSGPVGRRLSRRTGTPWQLEQVATREEQYLRQARTLRRLEARVASGEDPRVLQVGPDGVERLDPSTDPALVREGLAGTKAKRRLGLRRASELPADAHAWFVSSMVIHPDVTEDPDVQARLDRFAAGRMDQLRRDRPVEAAPRAQEYRTVYGCLECHAPEYADWTRSPHAGAWLTLQERGETGNPDCLPCHTTGFGQPGGFVDPTQERGLLNVQCEACHGPMALHADQAGRVGFKPDPGLPVDEARCRVCHDEANSPRFDYPSWLPGMDHEPQGAGR